MPPEEEGLIYWLRGTVSEEHLFCTHEWPGIGYRISLPDDKSYLLLNGNMQTRGQKEYVEQMPFVRCFRVLKNILLLSVCMSIFLCLCTCTPCIQCSERVKESTNFLGIWLQVIVNQHMAAGNWIQVLYKSSRSSYLLTYLVSLFYVFKSSFLGQGRWLSWWSK